MAITLYLHVGNPLADAGHIASLLAANREHLQVLGYGVCDSQMKIATARSAPEGPDAYLAARLAAYEMEEGESSLPDLFAALRTQAERLSLKAVVLSAPSLCQPLGAEMMAAAQAHFDCRILYYFNRQDDYLVAAWMAGVFKKGIGLHAYINQQLAAPGRELYRAAIAAYHEQFGGEAMRVQLLWKKVLAGGNLSADFWKALDLDGADLPHTAVAAPVVSADLAGALKESPYLFADEGDHALTSFIAACQQGAGAVKANPLDNDLRRRIMQHYQPENRWIKTTFFADTAMPGWNAVPDSDDRNHDVTITGVTEMLNLNLALLKDLREDVDLIKKKMGLK